MRISGLSESDILKIADPIRQDVIDGSNSRDWRVHSKNLPRHVIENEKIKEDVERQWREDEAVLSPRTSLSRESEYLGIIRKEERMAVLWKQTSTKSDEEYLLTIVFKEIDDEIQQIGALLD